MARNPIKEEGVEAINAQDPIIEQSQEGVEAINAQDPIVEQSQGGAEVSPSNVVVTKESKKVKIRAVEDIDCLIACKPYKLSKGKEYSVPSDVAAILCYGEKAFRL